MLENEVVNSEYNSIIERNVSLSIDEIIKQSFSETQCYIENRIQKKFALEKDNEIDYRGSILLAFGLINYNLDSNFDRIFLIK